MQRFNESMKDCGGAADGEEDPMADDEFELEMEREFQRRADDAEKMGRLSAAVADRDQGRKEGRHRTAFRRPSQQFYILFSLRFSSHRHFYFSVFLPAASV